MADDLSERIRVVVTQLFESNNEYAELIGLELDQALGSPTPEEAILRLEQTFGDRLSPTYRAFLTLHNGWKGFMADVDLLTVSSHNNPEVVRRVDAWRRSQALDGNALVARALPIAVGMDSYYVAFLDPASRRADGEMDVGSADEDTRESYPDFLAFLEGQHESMRELIAEETGTEESGEEVQNSEDES